MNVFRKLGNSQLKAHRRFLREAKHRQFRVFGLNGHRAIERRLRQMARRA